MTKSSIEQVKEFHEVFGHPIAEEPCILPLKRGNNRVDYMLEELKKYQVANDTGDLIECLDALMDLQYFLDCTLVEHGVAHLKDELFAEIHRSNMSKVCINEKHAIETLHDYIAYEGIKGYYNKVNNYWVCYRTDNNKVLKANGWSKPNLNPIINKALGINAGNGSS